MQIERWGYRITLRWPWLVLAALVVAGSVWAYFKGWLVAAILGALLAIGIIAGPGIDVEKLSDLKETIKEYPDIRLDDINKCFTQRRRGEELTADCR